MFQSANVYFFIDVSEKFIDNINGFKRLPRGWHHGEGIPPKRKTINEAINIANYAYKKFLLIDSAPGLDGEVQIALYHPKSKDNQYLECTFEGNNNYNITLFKKQNNRWRIVKDSDVESLKDIESEIDNFVREIFLWEITSGSYPKDIFTDISEDLQVSLLKTTGAAFLLSENLAFQTPEPQYATT